MTVERRWPPDYLIDEDQNGRFQKYIKSQPFGSPFVLFEGDNADLERILNDIGKLYNQKLGVKEMNKKDNKLTTTIWIGEVSMLGIEFNTETNLISLIKIRPSSGFHSDG